MSAAIDIKAAKQRIEKKKYARSVLDAFDRLKHQDKRQQAEKRAEVRREARNKL